MKTQMTIPYFTIDAPYELAYRNNGTSSPARPHTHNALEIYLTMSDLPDVLLDDTVSRALCVCGLAGEADHL